MQCNPIITHSTSTHFVLRRVHLLLPVCQVQRLLPVDADLHPGPVGEAHLLGAVGADLLHGAVGEGDVQPTVGVAGLLLTTLKNELKTLPTKVW